MSAYGRRDRPPTDSHRRRDAHDDRDARGSRHHHHSSRSNEPRPASHRQTAREAAPREAAPRPAAEAAPAADPLPPPPSMPPPPVKKAEPEIDRTKVCPLLLRVFHKLGGHHRLEEFSRVRSDDENDEEVQIYTWPDATLRELSDLVKEVQPQARMPTSRMGFALVYPDRRGHNVMRVVGQVHSSRVGEDDVKTLRSLKFQTGDYLDVAVF